jgi:hypothetical protein
MHEFLSLLYLRLLTGTASCCSSTAATTSSVLQATLQVMTGDDWTIIVRDLMVSRKSALGSVLVALFFTSFQLLVPIVLVNVVVRLVRGTFEHFRCCCCGCCY